MNSPPLSPSPATEAGPARTSDADALILRPDRAPFALFLDGPKLGGVVTGPAPQGLRQFPPRLPADGQLGGPEDADLARTGSVASATRVMTSAGTHVLALIDLDGGGRLLARLRTRVEDPRGTIGARVRLVTARDADEPFLTFELHGELA